MTAEWQGPVWFRGIAERVKLPIFHRVVSLRLRGAKVDDPMLESIASFRQLRSLTLVNTRATRRGLSQLEQLRRLEELTLVGAQINDNMLGALSSCARLRYLSLSGTATTSAGIARLQRSLPTVEISNRHPVTQAGS